MGVIPRLQQHGRIWLSSGYEQQVGESFKKRTSGEKFCLVRWFSVCINFSTVPTGAAYGLSRSSPPAVLTCPLYAVHVQCSGNTFETHNSYMCQSSVT
jgi:hypothetical protein